MALRPLLVSSLLLAGLAAQVSAIFVRFDTQQVPVERLVANLERTAKDDPTNSAIQINLARLHAMAYALKVDTLPASTKDATPDLGNKAAPEAIAPAPSADHAARAADHLKKALQHYDLALKLSPNNMIATLGRGWARQQAGDRTGAIADLRAVIAARWPEDSKTKALMPSQQLMTVEAIGYLLPLLDRNRDAAEIQDLLSKQTDLKNRPRAITPIAIPLDDRATVASIVDRRARVRFDADGSALDREWTWIAPRAGWLVYDWNGRGEIGSALQLFGNVTFWLFWTNGYHALAALDDDGSGRIEGSELRHLALWHDADANGRSDPGEVRPLAAHGIQALSFDYVEGNAFDVAAFAPRGVTFTDGRTRPTYDIILRTAATQMTRR